MDIKELMKEGKDLRDKGKYDEALEVYESALDKCPKYVPALIGKGVALRGLKRYGEALIAVNKAIEVGSESTDELAKAWSNKGFVLRDLKRYGESLEAFKISISFNPESAFLWNAKGLVLLNLQKYDEAIEAYTTSLDKNSLKNEQVRDEQVRKEYPLQIEWKALNFCLLSFFL